MESVIKELRSSDVIKIHKYGARILKNNHSISLQELSSSKASALIFHRLDNRLEIIV